MPVGFCDLAEADEGAHLVGVAADGLGEAVGAVHLGVGGHFQQVFLAGMGAPDQAVEQGEALGLVVLDDCFGEGYQGAWDVEGCGWGRARGFGRRLGRGVGLAEEVVRVTDGPGNLLGWRGFEGQAAGGAAPAGPVDLVGENDALHQANRSGC